MLEEQKVICPDTIYGTAPFWAWNGTMTEDSIKKTIAAIKESGFGGAFVHPRPGLTNAYLSEEWFSLWKTALEEAKRAGIKLYIYDENTYPTGYAGGQIMSRHPDCAAQSVKTRIFASLEELRQFQEDPVRPEEERKMLRLYKARRQGERISILEDVTEYFGEEPLENVEILIGISLQQPYASAWFGGFPNTDILRPEVTKALLESTYEEYSRRFQQDFGSTIPAVFSDEPGISPGNVWLEDPMVFPFSRYFASEFYKRRGYSFEDHMVCIPLDIEEYPGEQEVSKVRFDYYCTLRELWAENFAKPMQEWCSSHGIAWTGHFLDEHWPYPWGGCAPAVMSMYEYMHWPGIDMLMSHMLKEDGKSPMLLSVKELASAGRQLGKERLLCECYGAGGWDASITDFKRIGDWLAIHGITFFNQHLWLHSLTGVRKHGHPQSFDPREPWWEEYKQLTPYYARLSYLLSLGQTEYKVLILHPTTSWMIRCPAAQKGDILWRYQELPEDDPVKTYIEFLQCLNQNHIGFDLGDEFILQKYGKIEGKFCIVGQASYDCLVIPAEMIHMLSSTVYLVETALEAGIPVYCLGKWPAYTDGRLCESPVGKPVFTARIIFTDKTMFMQEMQRQWQILPIRGEGIECTLRQLESGERICCFSNSTPEEQSCLAKLPGTKIWRFDLFTGKKYAYAQKMAEGKTEIRLHPCEMLVLYWSDCMQNLQHQKSAYEKETEENTVRERLEPICIKRKEENVLVLDYGNLYLRDREYSDIHVMAASEKIFHAHGMERNPWDMAVQFENRNMERNHFEKESGFSMKFCFEAAELPESLMLACEHPKWYQIRLNGHLLSWNPEDIWLDEEFGKTDIRRYVLCGKNEIQMTGSPFHLLMELQPVYLLGNFRVQIENRKFVIRKEQPLEIGSLKRQGLCFYGNRIQYTYRFFIEEGEQTEEYRVSIGDYEGTALSLYVNGEYAGQAGIGMGDEFPITPWVKFGWNDLKIELSCSLKNLFGPFHTQEKIRNSAWPAVWKQAPVYTMPDPAAYDTIDYCLKENPVLIRSVISQKSIKREQNT